MTGYLVVVDIIASAVVEVLCIIAADVVVSIASDVEVLCIIAAVVDVVDFVFDFLPQAARPNTKLTMATLVAVVLTIFLLMISPSRLVCTFATP